MTQSQIIKFCEKHAVWLRQDVYGTFFLIKENGAYFVVRVYVGAGGLEVSVGRFDIYNTLNAENRYHIVAPQLSL